MSRLAHTTDDHTALHGKDQVDSTREIAIQPFSQQANGVAGIVEYASGRIEVTVGDVRCFWRDLSGKWSYSIRLGPTAAELDLPAGRSLIHRPPEQHLTIPYADIKSVETRLEAYGNLGIAMMQRAYVLRRKNDDLIFLFEDRALATGLENQLFPDFASDLAARAGVAVRDLGMVEGKNGFLGMWGTHAPDWAAPSLTLAQQLRLWRRAAFTGSLTGAVILLAFAIRILFGR